MATTSEPTGRIDGATVLVGTEQAIAQRMETEKPTGPAAAALLGAGVGCFALGLLTTTAELSAGFKSFLNLYNPVGPLSGKTSFAVLIYVLSWAILAVVYRGKNPKFATVFTITLVLVGIGLLGTFPIFYQKIAGE